MPKNELLGWVTPMANVCPVKVGPVALVNDWIRPLTLETMKSPPEKWARSTPSCRSLVRETSITFTSSSTCCTPPTVMLLMMLG